MNDPDNLNRLHRAVQWSRRQLQPFRENRVHFIRQMVGSHYSHDGAPQDVIINMLEIAVNTYVRQLVAKNPQALVQSRVPKLRERAKEFGLVVNHVYDEVRLGDSLRSCALDAMLGIGIMKVGLRPTAIGDQESWLHDTGKPFAEPVGLDDWVHDMSARRWDQCRYLGHRYRLPLEFVKDSNLFEVESAEQLTDSVQRLYNEEGDPRASSISSRETHYLDGEYERMVELWDLWLPFERKIITIPAQQYSAIGTKPLRTVEWDGPEEGPFQILSLSDVPDNTMPLAPAATWIDLHETVNTLYRKLRRQAERQKEIFIYGAGAEDDAQRIVDAADGESRRVDQPDKVNNVRFGGVDSNLFAFLLNAKDQSSYVSGNLDVLGGLGASTDTLGQDRLIAQSASQRLAEMQSRMQTFAKRVMENIAWYVWEDPNISVEIEKPITSRRTKTIVFDSARQEGDWLDYNVDIIPFSLQDLSPSERVEQMLTIHDRIILPNAQSMAQRGEQFDAVGFAKQIATYSQVPEMSDYLQSGQVQPTAGEEEVSGSNKPLETTRTYERVNRPSGTRRGAEKALTQTLLGAGVQDAEMDSIGRAKD